VCDKGKECVLCIVFSGLSSMFSLDTSRYGQLGQVMAATSFYMPNVRLSMHAPYVCRLHTQWPHFREMQVSPCHQGLVALASTVCFLCSVIIKGFAGDSYSMTDKCPLPTAKQRPM
jgi:hypothetical protein